MLAGCHLGDLVAESSDYHFIGYFQGWISSDQALQREDVKREEGTIGMEVGTARAAVGMILARSK